MSSETQTSEPVPLPVPAYSPEQKERLLAAARNLLSSGVRRAREQEAEAAAQRAAAQQEQVEEEPEEELVIEGISNQELLQHVESLKEKQKETTLLNKAKKEDKNTLIEALEEAEVEEMALGPYIISYKEKAGSNITVNQLKQVPGLSTDALGKICTWISENPSKELKVKVKRVSKKRGAQATAEERNQRSRTD